MEQSTLSKQAIIFNRIIENNIFTDHRSAFDKYIDSNVFREKFFSDTSEIYQNNPGYKLRTNRLIGNPELVSNIHLDFFNELTKDKATETVHDSKDYHPAVFYNVNAFSEDFLFETRMFNVGYSNEAKTPIAVRGYGFMYLIDTVTSRKILFGTISINKFSEDKGPKIKMVVVKELHDYLTSNIKHPIGVSTIIGKELSGFSNTLLKHSKDVLLTRRTYPTAVDKGRAAFHREMIRDIKAHSPYLIDIIQLTDLKKIMY